MKPFWKKPSKKKHTAKKSSRPKTPPIRKSGPEPWKPPEIPKMDFTKVSREEKTAADNYNAKKDFLKTFRELTYRHPKWQIWSDYVTMFACTLSNAVDKSHFDEREKLYLDTIKKYNKKEQGLFPELSAHTIMAVEKDSEQDFLGSIFMELGLSNERGGQFFTPYHICQFMSAIVEDNLVEQVRQKGYVTINDPCCGSGAMLIAVANEAKQELGKVGLNFQNHVLVTGQDIDFTVMAMGYIQLSLLGLAGYFKFGNSLTEPMTDGDSLENYWFTPMYFSPTWSYRRIFRRLDELTKDKTGETNGRG